MEHHEHERDTARKEFYDEKNDFNGRSLTSGDLEPIPHNLPNEIDALSGKPEGDASLSEPVTSLDDENTKCHFKHPNLTWGRFFGLILCFLFYVATLACHIAVCYFLGIQGSKYFPIVVVFTVVPSILLNAVSLHLHIHKLLIKRSLYGQDTSVIGSLITGIIHFFNGGLLLRYVGFIVQMELEYLWLIFCPRRLKKNGIGNELSHLPYLFLVEAIAQCFPQLVLQLYILICDQSELNSQTVTLLVSSIIITILNLTRLIVVCKHVLKGFTTTWSGLFFMTLWHLLMSISRVIAFAVFAARFLRSFAIFCACHWLGTTIVIPYLEPDVEHERSWNIRKIFVKFAKNALSGVMYLLLFMRINMIEDVETQHEPPTRFIYTFFYSVMFLENAVLSVLWFVFSSSDLWYHKPVLVAVFVSFLLGIVCMLIYYRYFHRNILWHPRRCRRTILFPSKREDIYCDQLMITEQECSNLSCC